MNKTKISAKIILHSKNAITNEEIITYELIFPRYILAELNTHRVFSKNSASSRAIPFRKMVEMVKEDPFTPTAWQKHHSGMQGTEYITEQSVIDFKRGVWLNARDKAVQSAEELYYPLSRAKSVYNIRELKGTGVTKQLANRLLEPFMWHKVLLTATEFDNFFELRCPVYEYRLGAETYNFKSWKELISFIKTSTDNKDYIDSWENETILGKLQHNKGQADIHMMALAEAMYDAKNESTPQILQPGQWHVPFGDNIDYQKLGEVTSQYYQDNPHEVVDVNKWTIKISTARCARISYQTLGDNPKIDYEADIKLHDMLLESGHYSPFEHCARVMTTDEYVKFLKVTPTYDSQGFQEDRGWCNNFKGFIQYRYLI